MKRFYKEVTTASGEAGWSVQLDGRPIKTQGGRPQIVPGKALADLLAAEWREQGEKIDPASFRFRDMADYAIDVLASDPAQVIEKLLGYAETDTLCYRAEPEDALFRRQEDVWEPIVTAVEAREGITLHRVSGVLHRPQTPETLARLRDRLEGLDPFMLAALEQLTALSASLCVGLESLEGSADGQALWDAANLEEDWQAELWGKDAEAQQRRDNRQADFLAAIAFAKAINT